MGVGPRRTLKLVIRSIGGPPIPLSWIVRQIVDSGDLPHGEDYTLEIELADGEDGEDLFSDIERE
jgi:hypothetical protein